MRIWMLAILLCVIACKTPDVVGVVEKKTVEPTEIEYQIMGRFVSQEAFKKALFEFEKLRLVVVDEVSATDNTYLMTLKCKDFEIDGIVTKLNDSEYFEWVKKIEP